MKIDSALMAFTESYDREAIRSIDMISRDKTLQMSMVGGKHMSLKLFNINESCGHFNDWLKGYASYKVNYNGKPEASSQEVIRESVTKMLESSTMFKEEDVTYPELPAFVEGYVNGVQTLLKTVDVVKSTMTENGVDPEAVGDVNDFCDQFMTKLDEAFHESMDKILWASGYNSRKKLFGKRPVKKTTPKPVFI